MTKYYTEIQEELFKGMNVPDQLTAEEKLFRRQYWKSIHRVPLNAHLHTWNDGAWFILKPRFYSALSESRLKVNAIVQEFLKLPEEIDIDQDFLDSSLMEMSSNQNVFIAFVVMKRISEKFVGEDFELNGEEGRLYLSLCEHLNTLKPEKAFRKQYKDCVGHVFDSLKNILAIIASNSTLQDIAFSYGKIHELGVKPYDHNQGLCDMSAEHFAEITQMLFSPPETKVVYDWLKESKLPGMQLISNLLAAILEQPSNVGHFLMALNLENKSARAKIDQIKLHLAAEKGHLKIVQALLESGANVNEPISDGITPLYIAAEKGHLGIVQALLESGANVNEPISDGTTPLYVAAENKKHQIVTILLGKDATVTLETSNPYDDPLTHRLFDILRTHQDLTYKGAVRTLIIKLESQAQPSDKIECLRFFKGTPGLRNSSIEQVEKAIPALSSLCKYMQEGINSHHFRITYSATRAILEATIARLERELDETTPGPKPSK